MASDSFTFRDYPQLLEAVENRDVLEFESQLSPDELLVCGAEDKMDGSTLNGYYKRRGGFYVHLETDATIAFEGGLWKLCFGEHVYSCEGESSAVPVGVWRQATSAIDGWIGSSAEVKVSEGNHIVRVAAEGRDVKFFHTVLGILPKLVTSMLEYAMDINCVDDRGISPLMRVAGAGCAETTRHLVSTIAFCISSASDRRVVGQWRWNGMHEGRHQCCRLNDPDVQLRWSSELGEWHMGIGDMHDSSVLYRNRADQEQLPAAGWRPPTHPAPAFQMGGSKTGTRLSTKRASSSGGKKEVRKSTEDNEVVFEALGCNNERICGKWRQNGEHHGQPQFFHSQDDSVQIKYVFDRHAERDGQKFKVSVREWQLSVDGAVVYYHPTPMATDFMPLSHWQSKDLPPKVLFLKADASENIAGRTPLMAAVLGNHDEVVKQLVEFRAHVDDCDNCGCTALMWAALGQGVRHVDRKAHREKPAAKAMREARETKQEAIVRHLVQGKANVNVEGAVGHWLHKNALEIAEEYSNQSVARLMQGYDVR